jgi:predicted transcriptional regulator
MANTKRTPQKRTAVFALIDNSQKIAIERLGRKMKRSIGFLVREAIEQYLAAVKKCT